MRKLHFVENVKIHQKLQEILLLYQINVILHYKDKSLSDIKNYGDLLSLTRKNNAKNPIIFWKTDCVSNCNPCVLST